MPKPEERAPKMSGHCRYFEQHAWKREICTNCFKPREEHIGNLENSRPSFARASANLKTDVQKLQSILRGNASAQPSRRKNVVFPESLSEVIGYGGNDFSDSEDNESDDSSNEVSGRSVSGSNPTEDETPDSEDDRALGNLTRANTNFNTVTANLTDSAPSTENRSAGKAFGSLMLGKARKDSDGKRKTLLVSVTPFGGDDALPTAKRPTEKKSANAAAATIAGRTRLDRVSPSAFPNNRDTDKLDRSALESNKNPRLDSKEGDPGGLEKIVDMPLIASSNLVSVIQKSDALTLRPDPQPERSLEKRASSITRCPAIKKPDGEKPKISLQGCHASAKSEYTVTRITKVTGLENSRLDSLEFNVFDSGVDFTETPVEKFDEEAEEDRKGGRGDIEEIRMTGNLDRSEEVENFEERTVEGEAGPEPTPPLDHPYSQESREHAGEPDGRADEAQVSEPPPALPRSLPPIETRESRNSESTEEQRPSLIGAVPRPSFLHGETKPRPAVPRKPSSLPARSIAPRYPSVKNEDGRRSPATNARVPTAGRLGDPATTLSTSPPRAYPGYSTELPRASRDPPRIADDRSPLDSFASSTRSFSPSYKYSGERLFRVGGSNDPRSLGSVQPPDRLKTDSSNESEEEPESLEEDSRGEIELDSSAIRSPNKRRMAPKPPAAEPPPNDESPATIFARNPAASNLKSDSPVVREKEKRERASSCSPKFRKAIRESPDPCGNLPEVAPRRTISLSQGSLATNLDKTEDKKKTRPRFSLKRLLRMGTRRDIDVSCGITGVDGGGSANSRIDEIPTTPQPKPRLEIIHPLELDGAAVEVLRHERILRSGEDATDSRSDYSTPSVLGPHRVLATRPGKPPPPPRNSQSRDDWPRPTDPSNNSKPDRPPPPRNEAKLPPRSDKPVFSKSWQPSSSPSTTDSIYANLAAEDVTGEARSALAPSKPQRTASMRDRAIVRPPFDKRNSPYGVAAPNYEKEDAARPPSSDSPTSNESNTYECLSSSPECDSNLELRRAALGGSDRSNCKRKSDSCTSDARAEGFKYQATFGRSTSLPYCGSETESELYAPHNFYTGDEGPEDDQDWKAKEEDFRRNRVHQRRTRSIVHRSLEDNYGAVIVANHEALAQLLERLNQPSATPPNLRSLKTCNPRFRDFDVDTDSLFVTGKRVFCSAVWNDHAVTLCLALDTAVSLSGKEFCLIPIIEFVDTVPENVSLKCFAGRKNVNVSVSVFGRMQVSTVQSFAREISRDGKTDDWTRESCFLLLQLVNALKNLQARGTEETLKNLGSVILCRDEKDTCHRLYLLHGLNVDTGEDRDEERVSLCQCALVALRELGLDGRLPVIRELLMRERAVTLSQVKSIVEFTLWGPSDAVLGIAKERELVLQRWLDLERANVLHALVRTRLPLTVTDEYQLTFLVRTSARIMCEASVLLEEQHQRVDSISSN